MNINDVKFEDIGATNEDMLDQIFRRQLELMQKYHTIEEEKGFLVPLTIPLDLHDAQCQYRLKDFAWRITEEVGEAMEALRTHPELRDHFDEEIADGLHFLVEFTLLAGTTPFDILPIEHGDRFIALWRCALEDKSATRREYIDMCVPVSRLIEALAITCNCLKNKPWKQTHMLTDVPRFRQCLQTVWYRFMELVVSAALTPQDMFTLYFRKSEVNKFRQRSNY